MCVFEQKHYGLLLNGKISEFLSEYTTMDDISMVAAELGLGFSMLKQVRNRNQPMSEKYSVGIIRLMETAVSNCGNIAEKAKADGSNIQKLLEV